MFRKEASFSQQETTRGGSARFSAPSWRFCSARAAGSRRHSGSSGAQTVLISSVNRRSCACGGRRRRPMLVSARSRSIRRRSLRCAATGSPAVARPTVFSDAKGRPLERYGRVRFGLVRVAAAAGLPAVTAHTLRHSHATWLAAAGIPAPVAAARLGHADGGALFMRVYAHPGAAEGEAALQALSAFRQRSALQTASRA
jgi:integrase